MNLNFAGNDEITDEERTAIDRGMDDHVAQLEKVAATSLEAKAWLNTALGKAVRLAIINNKIAAMKIVMKSGLDSGDLKEAQLEYAVWEKVEAIFGAVISEGQDALKRLSVMGGNG